MVQCQLRHLSHPHHVTHGAKGQWIKLGSKFDRVSGITSKMAPFFLPAWTYRVWKPLCTWYWSSNHRCYQREDVFEEEKKINAWQPQDAPNGLWRSQSESLVCQAVSHSPTCSTFPGNFTWDTWSPSSPLAQFINHICKQGDQRVWPSCLEKLEMGGTIFWQWAMEDATPRQHELGNHQIYYKSLFQWVGGKGRMWELFWVMWIFFPFQWLSCWIN